MKKLWTDLHSNIHHNQMDELDKWTEHAKEVLDFWPIAYYPFQMIKTESGAEICSNLGFHSISKRNNHIKIIMNCIIVFSISCSCSEFPNN